MNAALDWVGLIFKKRKKRREDGWRLVGEVKSLALGGDAELCYSRWGVAAGS